MSYTPPLSPSANAHVAELAAAGTSVWLDDLSRDRLTTGNLAELVEKSGIVGVTTNPAIFSAAMTKGTAYDQQLSELAAQGRSATDAAFDMAIDDVRDACDIFLEAYHQSNGIDGRVSIEVDPRFADDPEKTVAQAQQLWDSIDRPNLLVKIPATKACLPAITETLARGISVNVTLIFSVERYLEVMNAFLDGVEKARDNGQDLAKIESVASFFVSRVDGAIDAKLEEIDTADAKALRGKAGIANARRAFAAFNEFFYGESDTATRWSTLADAGAHVQRPLWASTSVKNPEYIPTLYVTELAGPNTVNTMPENTLESVVENGGIHGDALTGTSAEADEVFASLESLGIDVDGVLDALETDGVKKFVDSWNDLLTSIESRLS